MLDILLAVCCIVAGFCGGLKLSCKYTEKYKFYKSFSRYNENFYGEIAFFRKGIADLNCNDYISDDFEKYIFSIRNNSCKKNLPKYLSDSQKKDIEFYFNSVGKSDFDTQKQLYENYKIIIAQELIVAEKEQQKYSSLCKKTGILVGLAAFVILF